MGEQIISASGTQYGLIVNDDGSINIGNIAGSIVIGSVSANVESIYIQSGANITGSVFVMQGVPTAGIYNNASQRFVYDGYNNVGSQYKFIGAGSYVRILTWANGSVLTDISSWSVA